MGEQLTAAQRAANFAQATRQNMHMLASQTATQGATTLQFALPKARLLASIMCHVEVSLKATSASEASVDIKGADLHSLIRRWSLDLNNGFSPYVIGGKELYLLNLMRGNKGLDSMISENISMNVTADGANNVYSFAVEMPITLNDRDMIGLILLQNDQTNVTLSADIANASDIVPADNDTELSFNYIKISPMITTYSVPASANAFPDLSVLKLVNSRNDSFVGSGQHIIRLSTGTIYRRMFFRLVDEDGKPFDAGSLTSNIDLVFNQADVNYSISADMLRTLNRMQLGYELPDGMFMFDFSYQGIANLGGTRDYIDSERLTEFWVRFSSNKGGRFELVTECLARLQ